MLETRLSPVAVDEGCLWYAKSLRDSGHTYECYAD